MFSPGQVLARHRTPRQVIRHHPDHPALSAFLTPFMSSALNIALPSIAAEFALDAVSLSLVASSYLLATAIFVVFAALCTVGIFASLARGSVWD